MWSIARFILGKPPSSYCILGIVLLAKWIVWFPLMLIRYGFNDALDAALTTPAASRLIRNGKIGGTSPILHGQNVTIPVRQSYPDLVVPIYPTQFVRGVGASVAPSRHPLRH
jgi:hypothetical protein